jgi:hypothetical protein
MKIQIFVVPAWTAGTQVRSMLRDIHVNWIPALHAGMTESEGSA